MSLHSHSRVWIHLIWSTHGHLQVLTPGSAARVSCFLEAKAEELGIFMYCNYVNADHVHILIDLPVDRTIADVVQRPAAERDHARSPIRESHSLYYRTDPTS